MIIFRNYDGQESYLIEHCLAPHMSKEKVNYLKILFSSFGEEDFQRFTFNLLCSNLGYYFADNASHNAT